MFLNIKYIGYSNDKRQFVYEIIDTQFNFSRIKVPIINFWPIFLSQFYDEYEKRNISPVPNMLLLAKLHLEVDYKYGYDKVISFLKTKTDQKTFDKYSILL